MDAAASPKKEADLDKVYDFILKIENSGYPASIKQRRSVIKYTKLPDVDFDSRVTWHEETYSMKPRLRRIVTINEPNLSTTRSLKPAIAIAPKLMMPNVTKRKIVTIEEDDENDLHPKFTREGRKSVTKTCSRAIGTEIKEEKLFSQRTTSRLSPCSKYSRDTKNVKSNISNNKKENDIGKISRSKYSNTEKFSTPNFLRNRKSTEKDGFTRSTKSVYTTSKVSVSKNLGTSRENEKEVSLIKSKLPENWSNNIMPNKVVEKQKTSKSPLKQNRSKASFTKDIKEFNKPVTIIHVPLDEKFKKREKASEISESVLNATLNKVEKVDCSTEVERILISNNMSVGTEPLPTTIDQVTEIDKEFGTICNCLKESNIHTEELKEALDSLEIPNVTLIKDKSCNYPKEHVVNFCSKSLPNVKLSMFDTLTHKKTNGSSDSRFSKSASYIISRATLTYTTKQKINFHVVGNNEELSTSSPLSYPMSVVSLFKKQAISNKDLFDKSEGKVIRSGDKNQNECNDSGDNKPPLCPYAFDSNKLIKPSDIISTISVHGGLLQSDLICEQFQRELNFIDSFFESLQYLEHCSIAEKCLSENKVESWINKSGFDLKQLEYGSLLSKFDNETIVDDSETMASKSLCLLNLLIRDEQRRAKNLLFVLKMREDALKDFTKSQIIWLENKKKQDNIDISTLKKKQRGALLKLQHECGEMQRMRKALLTLSEKRKVALIKTKKNIELKLRNNIDVDQILLSKKKIKRNTVSDRGLAPVKCFDLSSSGCDDSTTSRPRSETPVVTPEVLPNAGVITSTEKSIQTNDSILSSLTVDQATNTADENFVVVDGGYLNILFHNLSLPQIFSNGKQYEVNEEALKNIVKTANNNNSNINEGGNIEKFMDQIKNHESDRSTSPSTARSLVEEFDQYYKGLVEEEQSVDYSQCGNDGGHIICEVKDTVIQVADTRVVQTGRVSEDTSVCAIDEQSVKLKDLDRSIAHACEESMAVESETSGEVGSVAGPLPVPAGAAASPENATPDPQVWPSLTSISSTSTDIHSSSSATISSMSSIASPVHCEAEELRRQQLAIEREIKALEQQQCQLLVVREIPDKPPPPYTPPNETRAPKPPRMFLLDDATEQKICKYISEPPKNIFDASEPFEVFVKDFCQETVKSQKPERSDKPWHSCNLLPQKQPDSVDKIVERTTSHLAEVLKGVTPTVVSGVGARRSDHIDDILFAEWRRCEPEWTALHSDEAVVKNQLFESIFQRILTETIDEYKRTVVCGVKDNIEE